MRLTKVALTAFAALALAAAAPASASTYERYHPNCDPSASAADKAECIKIRLYLYNSTGNNIHWDRIHASINADECRITLENGGTKLITGRQNLDVDSATWYNVGRYWHMPRACPVQIHARHPMGIFAKDEIFYFNFDSVKTEKEICWRLSWNEGTQADC